MLKKMNLLLFLSIALEVTGTTCMKLSQGFTHLIPSIILVISYVTATLLYIYIASKIELGIINAIWSGVGTTLISIIGIFAFGESISTSKAIGILIIIIGVFMLNMIKPQSRRLCDK